MELQPLKDGCLSEQLEGYILRDSQRSQLAASLNTRMRSTREHRIEAKRSQRRRQYGFEWAILNECILRAETFNDLLTNRCRLLAC